MNFYEKMKQRSMMEKADRPWYFVKDADYILCNRFCVVLIRATGEEVKMEPEVFDAFKRALWREEKSWDSYYDKTISYDVKSDDDSPYKDMFASDSSTEDSAMYHMTLDAIRRSMSELSDMQRNVLDDLYVKHMTVTEIAKERKISMPAVSYHKRMAKEKILNCLGERD